MRPWKCPPGQHMGKSKKRILYLCADSGISFGGTKGAAIHIREFVETLSGGGYDVVAAVSKKEKELTFETAYPVHVLPEASFYAHANIAEMGADEKKTLKEAGEYFRNEKTIDVLLKLHQRSPFDLIYERYSLFGIAGRLAADTLGLPFILEVNAPLVYEAGRYRKLHQVGLAKSIESFLFSKADHLVAVSSGLQEYILKIAPQAKISVIPNGVSLENFDSAESSVDWRKKLTRHPDTDFIIGFVGSIKPWHGVEVLIAALANLHTEDEQCSLCIVGNGDKNYQSQLEAQCNKSGLKHRVNFFGAVPYESIPAVMKSMDVLVAPYPEMENFYFSPLKIFEYMASGRPIVSSSIGQINDVLTNEKNALLVPAGDTKALSQALIRLKHDSQLSKGLSRAAYDEVRRKHLWRHRLEKIKEIMECLNLANAKPDNSNYANKL